MGADAGAAAGGSRARAGLLAYGAYLPHRRLRRAEIASTLGIPAGRGTRAVASYDEDATSMGVEAARSVLRSVPGYSPRRVYFATATPPYLDKTNATVIHAALGLDPPGFAVDMGGATRSGVGALLAGAEAAEPTLVVLADIRTGLPGSADERDGGDGAAALLFGHDATLSPVAEVLAFASVSDELLERWRSPGEAAAHTWDERFVEHAYGPHAEAAFGAALADAGATPAEVDHLVVAGLAPRVVRRFVASSGVDPTAVADDRIAEIGNAGTAQPGVLLADVLDRAEAGSLIALVVMADGVSVLLLRTTQALVERRALRSVADQVDAGDDTLSYATFLSWRGQLHREPPRRPDPAPPAAPPAHRRSSYKFGLVGSRCTECGAVHLPPTRVCASCRAVDRMAPRPMADVGASVRTVAVDHLAHTPSPPLVNAVLDFDGGGRLRCQLTDLAGGSVGVGDRVEMTFRKIVTAEGVHNYFWKARPVAVSAAPEIAEEAERAV